MSETMENDAAKKAFYKALAMAQSKIEGALKTATNPHFRAKYADLGAVWDACREPLTSNGFAVLQFPDYSPDTKCVSVETILTHTDGFEKSSTLRIPVSKMDAQGIGSAITYGRRYALMAAIGIAPEDDDGNAAVAANGNGAAKPAPQSLPKSGARDLYSELQEDITAADSMDALTVWFQRRKADIETLPADWKQNLRSQYAERLNDLKFGEEIHAAE